MIRPRLTALALAALILAPAMPADAGWFRCHRRARRCQPSPACQKARHAAPRGIGTVETLAATPTATVASQDSGSFVGWLNAVRARHGLGPVGWDHGLAADAARNSAIGYGHFTGGPGQCAGLGDLASVCHAWLASPAHAASLLNPGITRVGLAGAGPVWTLNAN